MQVLRVLTELQHLYRRDADFRRATDHIEQSDAELTGEAIVDHFERRHATAHQPHLRRDIERPYFAWNLRRWRGRHCAIVNAPKQGIDFILIEDFRAHTHWITKLVK